MEALSGVGTIDAAGLFMYVSLVVMIAIVIFHSFGALARMWPPLTASEVGR